MATSRKVPKNTHTHCRKCGAELFTIQAEAELVQEYVCSWGDCEWETTDTPFNETGERNYVTVYQCPNYQDKCFGRNNGHDLFGWYNHQKVTHIRIK